MTQAGGRGGLEPPFHCPSSTRLGEIEREIPPEFGRPGLARLRRPTAVLGAIAVDRSTCSGPVDQGFADAGMDDDNPALWNIRHDITPMFGRTTSVLSPSRISCCDPGHISRPGIFCGLRFSGWSAARSPEPRPSQRLQSGYATAAINEKHYGPSRSVCSTVIFSLLSSFPLLW